MAVTMWRRKASILQWMRRGVPCQPPLVQTLLNSWSRHSCSTARHIHGTGASCTPLALSYQPALPVSTLQRWVQDTQLVA
jgi:hypothetical protein